MLIVVMVRRKETLTVVVAVARLLEGRGGAHVSPHSFEPSRRALLSLLDMNFVTHS